MIGPPGAGKRCLRGAFPECCPRSRRMKLWKSAPSTALPACSASHGVARTRPFRAPHHTVSEVGLVGGGDGPRPGEVSLAHHGVLFLDELAEFRRTALEALRQPLEDGVVTISRARMKATFPARSAARLAMNPCACGWYGDGSGRCGCSIDRIRAYRAKDQPAAARLHRYPCRIAARGARCASGRASRRVERTRPGSGAAGAQRAASEDGARRCRQFDQCGSRAARPRTCGGPVERRDSAAFLHGGRETLALGKSVRKGSARGAYHRRSGRFRIDSFPALGRSHRTARSRSRLCSRGCMRKTRVRTRPGVSARWT